MSTFVVGGWHICVRELVGTHHTTTMTWHGANEKHSINSPPLIGGANLTPSPLDRLARSWGYLVGLCICNLYMCPYYHVVKIHSPITLVSGFTYTIEWLGGNNPYTAFLNARV